MSHSHQQQKPPLGSAYRCPSCKLVDNQLAKVGSARLDGSDFRVRFQIVCNSCGASSAACPNPAEARESWKLMSENTHGEQPEAATGATETHTTAAVSVVEDAPEVVAEFEEKWLGGARPKTD